MGDVDQEIVPFKLDRTSDNFIYFRVFSSPTNPRARLHQRRFRKQISACSSMRTLK
jgi:hypothetical protein